MVEGVMFRDEDCAEFRNHPAIESGNQESTDEDIGSLNIEQEQDFASKRMKPSPDFILQDGNIDSTEETSPLGLKLRKTPSFLNLLERKLSQSKKEDSSSEASRRWRNHSTKTRFCDLGSQASREKLKATNFPAILLRIGDWQWATEHEGDLTAKIYYAKRKMVWEVLNRALKSKIEIQWSDITAIRAIIRENEPGILEIELNQPPLFFEETNPQPRKHTLWKQASDFTGGQASIFRRHHVRFAPGLLDKHYEKLLQCDQRLFSLSHKPFPGQESPHFDSTIYGGSEFAFSLNGYGTKFLPGMQYQNQTCHAPFIPGSIVDYKTMASAPPRLNAFDEQERSYRLLNQRQNCWGEENVTGRKSDARFVLSPLDYFSVEDAERFQSNSLVLNDIKNHLLDRPVVCSGGEMRFTNLNSTGPLHEPFDVNPIDASFANQLHMNYQTPDTQVTESGYESPMQEAPSNSMLDGLDSKFINWLSHQDSIESFKMVQAMKSSLNQDGLPRFVIGDFSTPHVMQNNPNWP